jgi:hypothetical protein
MSRAVALLLFTLFSLTACTPTYGNDDSRLGDLIAHDALAVDVVYRDGQDVMVTLKNATSDGNCLSLATGISARFGDAAAEITPGFTSETGELIQTKQTHCPELFWKHIDPSAPALLTMTITDESRPDGDPHRSALLTLPNPTLDAIAWLNAVPTETGLTVRADEEQRFSLAPGETFDEITYYVGIDEPCVVQDGVGTCPVHTAADGTSYEGKAKRTDEGFSFRFDGDHPFDAVHVWGWPMTTGTVDGCSGAKCSLSFLRNLDFSARVLR